ncbi:MAG: prolyl-tRNA synthetase [Thermoleophilia bacterium]|nr:prolyl-tRNA synthetase [Thermoleophilia bacterium]
MPDDANDDRGSHKNDRAANYGLNVTPENDFAQWYQDIVQKAQLAENGPVRGTMVVRPYAWRIWELMQGYLDEMFKETGHENAYFPLLIPLSYITREADHIEGFAPELWTVTQGGGKDLEEPAVIRPTSETVIGEMMSKWIQTHRDLPLLLNQWANVMRWERRPRLFLRTSEFNWQEGHTAHADKADAMEETLKMLDVYETFSYRDLALPVVKGEKVPSERFPGAENTYTIEAMMRDGKALQNGTSHYLGTRFAEAFEITYQSRENKRELCHTTSWGCTTRQIGSIIMAHGDAKGLVLPPRVATHQVVFVPVMAHKSPEVADEADRLAKELKAAGVRAHVDHRDQKPGFKFNDWELKGVPLRIEIGPRDLEAGTVTIAQRLGHDDEHGNPIKDAVATGDLVAHVTDRLATYHDVLLQRATEFRDANTKQVDSWDDFVAQVKTGWASVLYDGTEATEQKIKEATSATPRCIPTNFPPEEGACFVTGAPSAFGKRVIFGRSY